MRVFAWSRVYLATAVVFLVLDAVWLGAIAGGFYREALEGLMRARPDWAVAGGFYAVFVVGVLFFAVEPARSARGAAGRGALFGFFTYATYDLTNLATIVGWPVIVALVDIPWGSALSTVTALSGYALRRRWVDPAD